MMKRIRGARALRAGAAVALALAFGQAAHADVMTIDMTTRGSWGVPPAQVASVASLTFNLNQDGTVAGLLNVAGNDLWYGFGIDSNGSFQVSNLSQGGVTAWSNSFGNFDTGAICRTGCTGGASFTLSRVGGFTSVQQLFTGTGSSYDGWFYSRTAEYAGVAAAATSGVPEPATWGMLLLGFGGLGYTMRRRPTAATRILVG